MVAQLWLTHEHNLEKLALVSFQMVGDGLTIRQIAERLNLGVKTIETNEALSCPKLPPPLLE